MIDKKQIEEALKNISELKQAINNNLERLKLSFISKQFIHAILVSAILFSSATVLCVISYLGYGSISNSPIIFKYAIIILPILSFINILIKKRNLIKNNKEIGSKQLFKDKAFSSLYLNFSIILFTAFALFLILLIRFDTPWLLLPLLVIAYGSCVVISANALSIKELIISGYLIILLGLATALAYHSSILLWTMIDVSIILFLFYSALLISYKKSN